jgi:hypothetical protein
MRYIRSTFAALVIACVLANGAAAQQLITNAGFESGLAGWTVLDQPGGDGSWFSQSGTGSPLNGFPVPAPPEGSFAAMTDQGGPGSHVLYQDFVVPVGVTGATFSFQYYLQNQNGAFFTPSSLDFTVSPNQQARVDIITTAADPFSVAGGDVLLNLYQTQVGDPATSGYSLVGGSLTSFLAAHGGQTLRLRFAEVDNQFFFQNGVDDVSIQVNHTAAVPEAGSAMLLFGGAVPLMLLIRRRRS